MTALRAVSFDAAGTLVHLARPVGDIYARLAARHGVHADPAEIERRFRRAFAAAPPLAFPGAEAAAVRAHEKAWWRALVTEVFGDTPFRGFDAYFEALFAFFASAAAWRCDPDAVPLLRQLRARGLAILVVSNSDARLHAVLDALGLRPAIDRITISSEVGAAKPDPRIFATALAAAGLEPAEVVHVGDTPHEDHAGARAAGLDAVLVGGAEVAARAPGAVVVGRLGDVGPLLARVRR